MSNAIETILKAAADLCAQQAGQHIATVNEPYADDEVPDFDRGLLALAYGQAEVAHENEALQALIDRINMTLLKPLQAQVQANNEALATYEASLRAHAEAYHRRLGHGPKTAHNDLTVKRVTSLAYDADEALAWAKLHAPQVVRVKESLKVREFEALISSGDYTEAEAQHKSVVAITKRLAHLIIEHEYNEGDRS